MDNTEYNAMKHVHDGVSNHHEQYMSKMIDLIKIIISLSAVVLSILASLYKSSAIETQAPLLLQISLGLLLTTVLLGLAAIHNDINLHRICIQQIHKASRDSETNVEIIKKTILRRAEPTGFHRYADRMTIILFCSSLVFLAWFAILNIN